MPCCRLCGSVVFHLQCALPNTVILYVVMEMDIQKNAARTRQSASPGYLVWAFDLWMTRQSQNLTAAAASNSVL